MANKKQREFWTVIRDEEHFNGYYNDTNKKLVVCEVHPTWSGPCEMMFPTYKNLALNIDDFDKRVDIILLKQEVIEENKNAHFKPDSCQPKFLFILEGKIKDEFTIRGANIPAIIERVNKLIPLAY